MLNHILLYSYYIVLIYLLRRTQVDHKNYQVILELTLLSITGYTGIHFYFKHKCLILFSLEIYNSILLDPRYFDIFIHIYVKIIQNII